MVTKDKKVELKEIKLTDEEVIDLISEKIAPPKPKKVAPKPKAKKSKPKAKAQPKAKSALQPKKEEAMPNVIMAEPTLKGKLDKTVTDVAALEKEITRIVRWSFSHLDKVLGNTEGMDYKKLGDHHVVCRVGETGSFGGNTDKDHNTKGHYCPSGTKRGEWDVNGVKGNELLINVWDLHNMSDEEFFNFIHHEAIHAYSDLTAETDKDRDCAKNGAHKQKFVDLVQASGLLDPVSLPNYVKWTTTINGKGVKAMKKLKVQAPKIGKTRAPKKAKAKRVSLECKNCELKVMVPFGKWDRGEVSLNCLCLGSENGVEMKANVVG
tara:strand:+ start:416 stop:1381 length:966 start_codon:yes stop_codon:yes gene_type:complete